MAVDALELIIMFVTSSLRTRLSYPIKDEEQSSTSSAHEPFSSLLAEPHSPSFVEVTYLNEICHVCPKISFDALKQQGRLLSTIFQLVGHSSLQLRKAFAIDSRNLEAMVLLEVATKRVVVAESDIHETGAYFLSFSLPARRNDSSYPETGLVACRSALHARAGKKFRVKVGSLTKL